MSAGATHGSSSGARMGSIWCPRLFHFMSKDVAGFFSHVEISTFDEKIAREAILNAVCQGSRNSTSLAQNIVVNVPQRHHQINGAKFACCVHTRADLRPPAVCAAVNCQPVIVLCDEHILLH